MFFVPGGWAPREILRFARYDKAVGLTFSAALLAGIGMSLYLLNESKCGLHVFHVFNGDYAASVPLAYLALELAGRYVTHYSAKEFTRVVSLVTGIN